ncbi:MAG: OpgC domain-containing protein, partial [Bradyrhizobium sp.]|nr:OpgC domain-containing protein [Bradyrhizobium sp.]
MANTATRQRKPSMEIQATLPPKGRDLRLDLFRGIANWAIFLDHI